MIAPTELCTALYLTVQDVPESGESDGEIAWEETEATETNTIAMSTYNGIYIKQSSLVNGRDWWRHRHDQPYPYADTNSTIYWTDDGKWIIETPDVWLEAPENPAEQRSISTNHEHSMSISEER